jgi:prepilin signal peptidase PulO-like enzyme (type II secretory pathway)
MRRKYIPYIFGILLFALGAILSGFIIKQEPQVLGLSAQSELTTLISKVGKLIVLPSDELPTVTTVSDAAKLNSQPFFKNAKNNDKLLVYSNSKWAVLYRPSENRIIEVGSFSVVTPEPSPSITSSPSPSPVPATTATPIPSPSSSPSVSPSPSLVPSPSPKI